MIGEHCSFRRLAGAGLLLPVLLIAGTLPAGAQEIPTDQYLRYVPLDVPRIISSTSASAALDLYGDREAPGYTDVAPVDGIDDRRGRVLQELAVRFAPFLVLNSEGVPMDFKRVWGRPYPLQVHDWNTADGTLTARETIDWMTVASEPCTDANPTSADCRLLDLLREYDPRDPGYAAAATGAKDPLRDDYEVLWIDMPGQDEKSWKSYWQSEYSLTLRPEYRDFLKTYVHPFLEDVPGPNGEPIGVQLVLQYWFFYPYNDGGNNHEGDWEHIHVVVSPLHLVEEPALRAADMRRLLDGAWLEAAGENQLVIKRLDYYFHSKVATLDFSAPNAYLPKAEWERQSEEIGIELNGEERYREFVRRLAWRDAAETEINTHPVGYIGADNKGLDQVLAAPGGTNRDSHGTYPFPGLFKDIGPAGATEAIANFFDHRKYFAGDRKAMSRVGEFSRGGVAFLGDAARIEIVPDYERVIELVYESPEARQAWSWLVLPLRFGYPAVSSPFAGVVSHAETGNLSVVGPAFNSGWNRSGSAGQYQAYVPHVLPRIFPTDLQDGFVNDWGYFNAAVPITYLPPFDLIWRVVAAPARLALQQMEPMLYPRETIPFRFIGLDLGATLRDTPDDYFELFFNEAQTDDILVSLLSHLAEQGADSTTVILTDVETTESVTAPLIRLQLFIGDKFSTTNSVVHYRSRLEETLTFNNIAPLTMSAELNWWEYVGSVRYNITTGTVRPYAKAGYGLSWYRLEDVAVNDDVIDVPDSPWIRQPGFIENLLPNTWHIGGGLELLTVKGYGGLPGGLDVSLSAEWLYFTNKLGVDAAGVAIRELVLFGIDPEDLPRERWVGRDVVNLTVTISY